jgi:hypothetical protein
MNWVCAAVEFGLIWPLSMVNSKALKSKAIKTPCSGCVHKQPFNGKVFDTVSIVVAPKYLEKARKIVPSWWGIWRVEDGVDSIPRIDIYRSERGNPKPDPISIAQLIWRDEAFELLKAHHLHFGLRNKPRKFLWMALVDFFPLEHLRMLVRSQLKMRRDWRSAGSNMRYEYSK